MRQSPLPRASQSPQLPSNRELTALLEFFLNAERYSDNTLILGLPSPFTERETESLRDQQAYTKAFWTSEPEMRLQIQIQS